MKLDSNIESKSLNNTYLNIIKVLFFFILKNIEFKNLVETSTGENRTFKSGKISHCSRFLTKVNNGDLKLGMNVLSSNDYMRTNIKGRFQQILGIGHLNSLNKQQDFQN